MKLGGGFPTLGRIEAETVVDTSCAFASTELSETDRRWLIHRVMMCRSTAEVVEEVDRMITRKRPGVKPGFFNHGLGI